MEFIIFVVFVILVFSHLSLTKRVSRLEEHLQQLLRRKTYEDSPEEPIAETIPQPTHTEGTPVTEFPEPSPVFTSKMTPVQPIPPPETRPEEPAGEFFLYTWFREQTLIKIGSIIFFLGAVWFVSYAIENNWISPLMRIVLGLLLACAVYVVGLWRKVLEQKQYQVLTVLGTGIFLGTVIASQFAFVTPVLPAGIAFSFMVISIAYTLFVALETKAEWLAVMASVAGLCVPLLIKFEEPLPILLLTYIFLLSASFLAVVFVTSWRAVSLTLLAGSAFHLALQSNSSILTDNMLWFFVVIFSALFFASTTVSVARTNKPTVFDVSALCLISIQFIGYAIAVALLPELSLFVAAAITAFVGYTLRIRGAGADSVSLYVAVSLICSLVGTTLLFDGFVLTIAYSVEALAIYLLSLRLATVERSVFVAATIFLLPLASGLVDLSSSVWENGIVHPEALGTLSVLITLGFAFIWTLRDEALQAVDWLRNTAASLMVGWYFFAVTASLVAANALRHNLDKSFVAVVLLSFVSGSIIAYVLHSVPRDSWRISALLSLIVPTVSSLVAFSQPAWQEGISHQPFSATLIFFFVLIGITVLYWTLSLRSSKNSVLEACAYSLVWAVLGYGFIFFASVWNALLDGEINRVVTSISYTFFIYLIINGLMLVRANAGKVIALLATLAIPLMLLVESLRFSGWADGVLSVDAIGLYVTITILALLGTSLLQYIKSVSEEEGKIIKTASTTLYAVSGLLVYMLVWIMSQTVFASEAMSVTVALFIYTVTGLVAYSYGRITTSTTWRRVGVLLLATVILRLGLIDVWAMESVWRVITFLGVGMLFIIAALLERSFSTDRTDNNE